MVCNNNNEGRFIILIKLDTLKGKIVEKRENYDSCAKATRVSKTTFSKKMNGQSDFSILQAHDLSSFLNLTKDEIIHIFWS